jgi:hypothetical protein
MGAFVGLEQPLLGHMSVDLRRLQAGVPEQFLHNPQICAVVEEVRGEAVAERVGVQRHG